MSYHSDDYWAGRGVYDVVVAPDAVVKGEKCAYCQEGRAYKCFWVSEGRKKHYFCRYNHQVAFEKQKAEKDAKKAAEHERKLIEAAARGDAPTIKTPLDIMQTGQRKAAETWLDKQPAGTVLSPRQFWEAYTGCTGAHLGRVEMERLREFMRCQPLWMPSIAVAGPCHYTIYTKAQTLKELKKDGHEVGQDAAG